MLSEKLSHDLGISFSCYRRNFFERRINSRMFRLGMENLNDYYNYIISNPSEIDDFLDGFTINYSSFFRNIEVFQKLNQILISCVNNSKTLFKDISRLSVYNKIRQRKQLNIWSCPCATGEEPYSIAMLLDQLNKNFKLFPDYEIFASDIDKNALQVAKEGIFKQESLSELKKVYKEYFKEFGHYFKPKYVINENLKNKIHFIEEDITKGHSLANKYDIIFCRYLFIYISRSYRENLVKVLENHLASGGLLILGKTESLFYSQTKLKLLDKDTRLYVKN